MKTSIMEDTDTQITSDKTNKIDTRYDIDTKKLIRSDSKNKNKPPKSKHETRRNLKQRHDQKQDTHMGTGTKQDRPKQYDPNHLCKENKNMSTKNKIK